MRLTRTALVPFAAALAIATTGAPATTAVAQSVAPVQQDFRSPDTRDAADGRDGTVQDLRSPDTRDAARHVQPSPVRPTPAPVHHPDGFKWDYTGLVVAGIVLALVLATTQRRRRHHRPQLTSR